MRNLCFLSPLEWEVFHCHLVMSSGFSKRAQNWGSPALPTSLLFLDPRCGWGRGFSCLYFPSFIQFCANHRPCLAYHVPIPSFFPFCFIILHGCFQSGLLPHFPAGISGSPAPHTSLNSHAFGQLQSCSQFVPLSWFSSKFGHFGGAGMDSIDFGC